MRECSGFFGNNTKKFEKEYRSFLKANPTLLLDFFRERFHRNAIRVFNGKSIVEYTFFHRKESV
jgi:hypothetical protein